MIKENVQQLFRELPDGVELVAAAKSRSIAQIEQAVAAGVKIIGENYVQEAEQAFASLGARVKWHFIGHLQRNKVKKAVKIFDMIETVDSLKLAEAIERISHEAQKVMPVLIEINSGKEAQKFGVLPQDAPGLVRKISCLRHIRVMGLMTMGPQFGSPELARPYFQLTRRTWEKIRDEHIENVEMKYLSMGMSNSYQLAIEEGANLIRIGGKIFTHNAEKTTCN